jgi:catechol 2,3-dioxygenase-like lactoylglutathione lyase family enzyme
MSISACHHVALCVADAAAAREFYANAIGLEEIPRPPEVSVAGAWYRVGATELHVFEAEGYEPPHSASFPPHLALRSEDFEATVERMRQAGVAFDFGPGKGPDGVLRAIARDPTGNVVEITDAPLHAAQETRWPTAGSPDVTS